PRPVGIAILRWDQRGKAIGCLTGYVIKREEERIAIKALLFASDTPALWIIPTGLAGGSALLHTCVQLELALFGACDDGVFKHEYLLLNELNFSFNRGDQLLVPRHCVRRYIELAIQCAQFARNEVGTLLIDRAASVLAAQR